MQRMERITARQGRRSAIPQKRYDFFYLIEDRTKAVGKKESKGEPEMPGSPFSSLGGPLHWSVVPTTVRHVEVEISGNGDISQTNINHQQYNIKLYITILSPVMRPDRSGGCFPQEGGNAVVLRIHSPLRGGAWECFLQSFKHLESPPPLISPPQKGGIRALSLPSSFPGRGRPDSRSLPAKTGV